MIIRERLVYDMVASDSYYRGEAAKTNALMQVSEESKEALRDLFKGALDDVVVMMNCFFGECVQQTSEIDGFLVVDLKAKAPAMWVAGLTAELNGCIHEYLADVVAVKWLEKFGANVSGKGVDRKLRLLMNRRRKPKAEDYREIKIIEV